MFCARPGRNAGTWENPLQEEERHKLMCASKRQRRKHRALLTKKIESKKCKKLKVAGKHKNNVKQEDKRALLWLSPINQATHTTLAEIMR